jgi:hypothetical protein
VTKYYFSSDRGVTWAFQGNVNERKSGFCSVMVASDGTAFICNHGSTNTNTSTRVLLYQDAVPGIGVFTLIDPPNNSYFFGRFCLTSSITSPIKVILIAQNPLTNDTTFLRTGYPAWSGWTPFANTGPEGYCAARGQDGRIGITYIQNSSLISDYKSVYFIETTNNGVSFSTPIKIYQAVFSGTGADSLAAFRGLAIAYKGNVPCVSFETVKQDPTGGNYFQKAPAKIRFWSSELPGSDPFRSISIADQSNVPIPSPDSIKTGVNDQFGSLSRPVIGVSSDNNSVFVVFQAFTNRWGGTPPDTTNFKALYITKATGNYNFSKPYKFTPDLPLRDWSYPSLSASNDRNSSSLFANVCALSDSIPGNYPNSTNNGQSFAQLYYIRLSTNHTIGINENQQTVLKYSLYQNFPNPFNPKSVIKYQISKSSYVSLKVYNVNGKEVSSIVNETLSPGEYGTTFDGSNLPSGVYFYKLSAGDFTDTKKMVLIK